MWSRRRHCTHVTAQHSTLLSQQLVSSAVHFIQLNLQHSKAASALLYKQLATMDAVVATIQEPWIKGGKILGLKPKGCCLYYDLTDAKPRTCIITKGLHAYGLPQLCGRDTTTVCISYTVQNCVRKCIVSSVYMPIEEQLPSATFEHLVQYCNSNKLPLVVACDTNAHHPAWGGEDCNKRGQDLCEFLATTNLEVCNTGSIPTFCCGNKRSIIDVTLASSLLYSDIHDWTVKSEDTMSDHRQIQFSLRRDKSVPKRKRNVRRTDWNTYDAELNSRIGMWFGRIESPADIECELAKLNSAIIESFHVACPERRVSGRSKVPWWSHDLKVLRQKANRAFHQAYKSRSEQDWQLHRAARRAFKKALRRSKRESWQNFCSDISGMHESARLHKILHHTSTGALGMLRLPDGQWTTSLEEAHQHLLASHFPGCRLIGSAMSTNADEPHSPSVTKWVPPPNQMVLNDIITKDRIEWAIQSMAPFKTPGNDGIVPIFLQKGLQHIIYPVQCIYKASLALGYIPYIWRKAKVAFIPKLGRTDYTTAKAFRPISLTSFLLKGMEKLVDRYLRSGPLSQLPINPRQHAYQAGKSTDSALHQLVGRIEKALDAREYSLGVFFDIEGAFDNTSTKSVKTALNEWKANRMVSTWICAMLNQRIIQATVGDATITVHALRGLPQGGGLSPLLWTLVANSLLVWLTKQGVFALGFADDGCVLITGVILSTICDIMQRILHDIENWCLARDLSVNPGKTELVLFTRRYKPDRIKTLSFFNQQLELSEQVKYLGVILDCKLTWKKHLDTRCQKALTAFYSVRRATGKTWGTSPKVVHWLYVAVIRPMLCYAAVVWWPRIQYATVVRQLEHLQRLACLYVTSAIRTTPTAALELIVGLTPLAVHIKQQAMASCFRLQLNTQWIQTSYGHTKIKNDLVKYVPLSKQQCDSIAQTYIFDKNYTVQIPPKEDWINNSIVLDDDVICYTDGSRFDHSGLAGASVYNQTDGEEMIFPLGSYTTVFQAEVYALLQCAKMESLLERQDSSIAICSDSQAALRAVSAARAVSGLVLETIMALKRLAISHSVRLVWIPGHCGLEGNENADLLARQATTSLFIGPEPVIGLSAQSIHSAILKWAQSEQNRLWQITPGCRQAKMLIKQSKANLSQFALKLCKRDLRILVGLLTGHVNLNRHLAVMKIKSDALCPLCGEDEETSFHFLAQCNATMMLRRGFFGAPLVNPDELSVVHWSALLGFAKTSKRFQLP